MRRSSRPIHGKSAVVIGAGAIGSHLLEHVARMPEVDRVIGNVGYLPDVNLTRELHVSEFAEGNIRQPEPG